VTAPLTHRSPLAAPARRLLVLRIVAALALGISAYLHVVLASGPLAAGGKVTMAGLFVAQAVVAAVVGLWVLLRGGTLAWLATAAVGLASLGALVLASYVTVPSVGPFPPMYDPEWYPSKLGAAGAAAVAAAAALAALGASRLRRR
jgi:hypothetical protein